MAKGNDADSQTKAGLMSKGKQNKQKTEDVKKKKNRTDDLPKVGKHEAEGERESEGLH